MASNKVKVFRDLKGKRIAVSQLGDGPHIYALKLLTKFGLSPRDVEWVPVGTDGRVPALISGRVDATMLNAPSYFRLEESGFHSLANIIDYDDIYGAAVHLYTKATIAARPQLPEQLLRSHAAAVDRFYKDKAFAVRAFLAHDRQDPSDVARMYDFLMTSQTLHRVPYIPAAAVRYIQNNQYDNNLSQQMRRFDFRTVIDNSLVTKLVREGFFESIFGSTVVAEETNGRASAF